MKAPFQITRQKLKKVTFPCKCVQLPMLASGWNDNFNGWLVKELSDTSHQFCFVECTVWLK